MSLVCFFFCATATTEIYTLSLHDALPIYVRSESAPRSRPARRAGVPSRADRSRGWRQASRCRRRSEEHTSELQSQFHLVCRLLLEKKKSKHRSPHPYTTYTPTPTILHNQP